MTTPFMYTALGDSLTFGTGADAQQGFVHRVHRRLQERRGENITLYQHGTVGATTTELLQQALTDENLREHLRQADLITLSAGGNDIIQAAKKMYMEGAITSMKPAMRAFQLAYDQLLGELLVLNRTVERGKQIVLLDVYNPLPMFTDAVLWIRFLNRCINRAAEAFAPHVRIAQVYPEFLEREEDYIADDGFHPNGAGHSVMAECVARELSLAGETGRACS